MTFENGSSDLTFLKIITPTNLRSEKKKFFASKTYHPQFKYLWQAGTVDDYSPKSEARTALLNAIYLQDVDKIVKCAQDEFQTKITPLNTKLAKELTSKKPTRRFKPNPEGFKRKFEKALKFFSIDYEVVLAHEHGYNFRPNHGTKIVKVSKFGHRDFFSLDGSVKHEMVHVIRAVNGEFNGIEKTIDFLPTEEGLACFMQDYHGRYPRASRFQHAAEYLATQVGLNGSLRNIVDFLRFIGFPKDLAWQRAVRHKFGFVDTSRPGDIMKPAMYFHHEQRLRRLPAQKIVGLFVGKISVSDLPKYKKYSGVVSEAKLRKFFSI